MCLRNLLRFTLAAARLAFVAAGGCHREWPCFHGHRFACSRNCEVEFAPARRPMDHRVGAGRQRTLEPDHHNPLGHWGGAKPGQFGAGKKRGRGVQEALMVLLVSGTAFTPRRILRRNGDKCDQPRSKQQPEIVGNGRKWSLRLPHPDYLN